MKSPTVLLAAAVAATCLLAFPCAGAATTKGPDQSQPVVPPTMPNGEGAAVRPLTIEQIANQASPSVPILCLLGAGDRVDPIGSGLVVAPGLVATCAHVIANQDPTKIKLAFQDRPDTDPSHAAVRDLASVAGIDWAHDIALLSCDTGNAKPLPLDTSESIRIGDPVVSVSCPLIYFGTVTTGIVSHWRTIQGVNLLQTTAPISPGSSGSPIFDQYGHVIGVSAMLEAGPGANGLFFAVSARYIKALMDQIAQPGAGVPDSTINPGYVAPELRPQHLIYHPGN